MTAKEKVLVVHPDAVWEPRYGAIYDDSTTSRERLSDSTWWMNEEAAWQNVTESLPVQPEQKDLSATAYMLGRSHTCSKCEHSNIPCAEPVAPIEAKEEVFCEDPFCFGDHCSLRVRPVAEPKPTSTSKEKCLATSDANGMRPAVTCVLDKGHEQGANRKPHATNHQDVATADRGVFWWNDVSEPKPNPSEPTHNEFIHADDAKGWKQGMLAASLLIEIDPNKQSAPVSSALIAAQQKIRICAQSMPELKPTPSTPALDAIDFSKVTYLVQDESGRLIKSEDPYRVDYVPYQDFLCVKQAYLALLAKPQPYSSTPAELGFEKISFTPPDSCSDCGYRGELLPEMHKCRCCGYVKQLSTGLDEARRLWNMWNMTFPDSTDWEDLDEPDRARWIRTWNAAKGQSDGR